MYEQRGLVAGLNLPAVKPNIGDHRFEEDRRALLHHPFAWPGDAHSYH
jgi:hypothetical protein